ncbi:hypothetical protein D9758_010318 [Tetrapyrgos nigripes]|uniref:GST N-terminal domain-containing protein n=1 Tax=Tetrapyrgos nigripes TaxID=182062 RepID=A0A8H5GAJ7_9AGAR|nr:hypothetical protein D9758_010318 [Tetrapyrgos nigripes]
MSNDSDNVLIFYDIPSRDLGPWSPNTWKTRYALNFKNIPYKTIWVEYPDIEPTLKQLNIAPCMTKADGVTPHYTLPAIYDPVRKEGVTDSLAIAVWLDERYPEAPKLVPEGTLTFHKAFLSAFSSNIEAMLQFTIPKVTWALNERSEGYFRKTREERFGMKMEELYPEPGTEKRKGEWKKLEEGLGKVAGWYGKDNTFVMEGEDSACFADFMLGGFIIWIRILFGKNSEEWKDVASWHGGRLGRLIKALEKYE